MKKIVLPFVERLQIKTLLNVYIKVQAVFTRSWSKTWCIRRCFLSHSIFYIIRKSSSIWLFFFFYIRVSWKCSSVFVFNVMISEWLIFVDMVFSSLAFEIQWLCLKTVFKKILFIWSTETLWRKGPQSSFK